ncbi:hypothetical protein ACH437_29940 [Streptomyces xinghaiensis]|uniref:hypothetical protein n=1 Tax=Streptomyces xinghaiensis TaxID=1038928 RepID=UPI0037AC7C15
MVEAEHVRRLLCADTQYLTQTAQDFSLPHPVATTLTNVVDDIGRTDPATLRSPVPAPAAVPSDVEASHQGAPAAGDRDHLHRYGTDDARPLDAKATSS